MYVSRLDRPWLETPFLFQGFMIKSCEEIEELRRYCDHVYVEVDDQVARSLPRGPSVSRARAPSATWLSRVSRWLASTREDNAEPNPTDTYVDTVNIKVEIPLARQAHARASATLQEAMEKIRVGGKLDLRTLEASVHPMIESVLRNQDAMTWLSRLKQTDDYTYGHSVSCAIYAIAFGRHLGLPRPDLEILGLGGLLLDVGKTKIPKALLAKREKLTADELNFMREHVHHGEKIVREQRDVDPRLLIMVRSHHERYDGSGYPDGLKGPNIHVFARMAGIVDFYDALITPRAYAPAISSFDAMRELNKRADTEFQREMVEQFIQAVGVFPNGALVELSNGSVAVVVEQNRVRRLRPRVMIILDHDKQPLAEPRILDLREHPADPGDKNAIWIDGGLEMGAYGINPADYYL
jgi:HD-GYP domain-containing protein (c-di-GMP phosphodiesterase class II)